MRFNMVLQSFSLQLRQTRTLTSCINISYTDSIKLCKELKRKAKLKTKLHLLPTSSNTKLRQLKETLSLFRLVMTQITLLRNFAGT